MPTPDNTSQPSPFEITTSGKSKKTNSKGIIIALVIFVFLALGVFVGVLLVRQNQEVREEAAATKCPAAQACPLSNNRSMLWNCTPPDKGDNTPVESVCDRKGRIESCGGKEYCCPSVGGAWTTNMTACTAATATATAASTATSQATGTSAATSTSTSKATSTAKSTATSKATTSATKAPIPETGTDWPTFMGLGLGVLVIVGSLLLAL